MRQDDPLRAVAVAACESGRFGWERFVGEAFEQIDQLLAVGQLTRVPIRLFESRVQEGEIQVRLAESP